MIDENQGKSILNIYVKGGLSWNKQALQKR